jgi:hypothetical protein
MKLNAKKFGLAAGIVWGLNVFLTTLLSHFTGYGIEFLSIMLGLYPGYSISPLGSIIGMVYGFVDFFVIFYLVGRLYNWMQRKGKDK